MEKKHVDLMRAYGEEVSVVHDIFHAQKNAPTAPLNSAPRSGAVNWVRGLKQRIEEPMARMQTLNNLVSANRRPARSPNRLRPRA